MINLTSLKFCTNLSHLKIDNQSACPSTNFWCFIEVRTNQSKFRQVLKKGTFEYYETCPIQMFRTQQGQ